MAARVPPHNKDAEMSVLGGLMVDQHAFNEITGVITEDDFYYNGHRRIFSAIQDLAMRSQPIDIITVANVLTERKELEAVGGAAALADVMNSTPTSAHIGTYAKIVAERSLLRKLIGMSNEIVEKAYNESYADVESFLDEVEGQIFSLADKKKQSGLTGAAELIKASIDKLTELANNKSVVTGIPSGFTELDKMTAGFQPGELSIIAARPSMGKTAFSLNIVQHAAIQHGKSIAYFSVEMAKEQLMMRMLASEARVNLGDLRVGSVNDSAWPKLIDKATKMAEAKIFIDDTSGISPFEVRAKCRRLQAQHGLDMIVIDYLQLMDLKQKTESRERMISEVSRTLKAIAKELRVPVIALAQLNRGVEGRTSRRPMLSDLRESGSIEQDADVIMMLYREEYYDRENPDVRGLAEVIVGKQRNGPVGDVKLKWEASMGRFSNLEGGREHPLPPPPTPIHMGKPRNFAPGTSGNV